MFLCYPAILVLIISIINTSANIIIFNFHLWTFITDIIMSIVLIFLVNFFCSKKWMAASWIISIFLALSSFLTLYLYRINDSSLMEIINEKKNSYR
jgi:hypothetical protein